MRPRLVKLVRDKIASWLPPNETSVKYKPINDEAIIIRELHRKLGEESLEFIQEPSVAELVDVITVAHAIAERCYDLSPEEVEELAAEKAEKFGWFNDGIGMYVMTLEPEREEKPTQ